MNLGKNIYRNRTAKNWSRTDLAEALNVSRQTVSKWENNAAMPDLDKLTKMREIFNITLDELIYGKSEGPETPETHPIPPQNTNTASIISSRVIVGTLMMVFGAIFLLLSIYWGDNLYFGEAFGELFSSVIVLVSIALIMPHNFRVLAICTVIYFIYSVICFGVLNLHNVTSSIFMLIASFVIIIWFIVCGTHAQRIDN